jgi:AraC family transcriptional regulator
VNELTNPTEGLGFEPNGLVQNEPKSRHPPNWLRFVKARMEATGETSVAALAKEAGVHPMSFARAFRRHFGCSPGEHARRLRLANLRAAIQNEANLAELALAHGFADQSQMTRAFTRAFSMPPARYRRTVSKRQDGSPPPMAQ